jgi:Domain of unknown function (DUF4397)
VTAIRIRPRLQCGPIVPYEITYTSAMSLTRIAQRSAAKLVALVLILLPVVLAGCTLESGGFIITLPAHMRVVNVLVDGGPLNVTIDGDDALVTGLPFEGLTTYNDINAGNHEITISFAGGSTIADTTTLFLDDAAYTYLVYGTPAAPVAQLISDPTNLPGDGQFALRVSNAAAGSGGFDVYVTQPNVPLDNMSPNIGNIQYGATTLSGLFTSGTLQLRLTLPNSKQVIYDAGTLTFNQASSYWFVGYTKGSSTLLNGAVLALDETGSGSIVNSRIAQFKLIHAAPGTAAINALVDGSVALANVPYQGASGYEALSTGTHTVTIETVTSPGATIASAQPPFPAATDTSIVVTGTPGSQTAVVLADSNLPGATGSARVRFANVAPNLGPVDVLVDAATQVSGLATNTASGYVEVIEGTHTVDFDIVGTTTVVLSVPEVGLLAGHTYTLYLTGTAGQLAGVLVRDD